MLGRDTRCHPPDEHPQSQIFRDWEGSSDHLGGPSEHWVGLGPLKYIETCAPVLVHLVASHISCGMVNLRAPPFKVFCVGGIRGILPRLWQNVHTQPSITFVLGLKHCRHQKCRISETKTIVRNGLCRNIFHLSWQAFHQLHELEKRLWSFGKLEIIINEEPDQGFYLHNVSHYVRKTGSSGDSVQV